MSAHPYREPAVPELGPPARLLVPPPRGARRVARALALATTSLLVVAALAPWQQSAVGTGRVVAYAPLDRQQTLEAPIDGRVVAWHVREGSAVVAGDVLCDLADNDPELTDRLERERELTALRVESYRDRTRALEARLSAVRRAQDEAVQAAQARVGVAADRLEAALQALAGAEAEVEAQLLNRSRTEALAAEGLVSSRELELAILADARARTARDAARAAHAAAGGELEGARAALGQARASRDAEVDGAEAALASAETDLQGAEASLLRLESRIARQRTQRVVAPRAGTVLRILANEGGEQVRAGDPLLVLVPDTDERAVELWIDGNDASLVTEGRPVRLQFEGWPAVQFAGWPSVAVGTFGGVVAFLDATDDGAGNFRIVVRPDPTDEPWPETRYLRQGVRANGWVLLGQVRLGFELWRQLNGFPPTVSPAPSTGPSRASAPRSGASSRGGYGRGSSGYGGGGAYGGGAYAGGDEEGGGY